MSTKSSCGINQFFFIMVLAKFFQNIFISARKLQNPTHLVRYAVLLTIPHEAVESFGRKFLDSFDAFKCTAPLADSKRLEFLESYFYRGGTLERK